MLSSLRMTGFIALAMTAGIANAESESSNLTAIFDPVPECASSCLVPILQSSNCLASDEAYLAECLCQNITIQSDINICVQLNCNSLLDQKNSFAVENQICAAYPVESRAHVALITAVVTIAISIPVVIARCATRIKLTKKLWPDDYMSLLSLAALLTIASIQIFSTTIGSGKHYWNTDPEKFPLDRQLFYAAKVLYVFVQCTGKIAILLLYQRVFVTANSAQWFRRAVKVMLVLTFAIEGAYIFIIAFQCLPVASLWDPSIADAKCLNAKIAFTAGAVLNIASDVVLMALPIPALWKLQTSLRKRAGVAFMLGIASLGIVASLVRVKFLVAGSSVFDNSFYQIDVFAWSLIELLCVVACGSVPALRPLLVQTLSAIRSSVSSTFQRSRGTGLSKSSRKSELITAQRYSAVVKKQVTSDTYSLSHFSATNSMRNWTDDFESPLERSPVIVRSRTSDLVDIEAANIGSKKFIQSRPSLTESEEELMDTPHK